MEQPRATKGDATNGDATKCDARCDAEYYGKCGGQMYEYPVVYHCRPRHKDLSRGHGPSDSVEKVILCEGHYNEISSAEENKQLPELYGWDFADSLEYLTGKLKYTGLKVHFCEHCKFYVRDMQTDTGACSKMCTMMTELNEGKWNCICAETVVCTCAIHMNNPLHWALLTYVNGFDQINDFDCDACVRPSWRDSHDQYKCGLFPKEAIIAMTKANPELMLEENAYGKTPLDLISLMITALNWTLEEPYLKCAESGWATSNIATLEYIKAQLM
jgi:hypothetical protein